MSLMNGDYRHVKEELDAEDENEKVVANSYVFTEELILAAMMNEIDLDLIYEDLQSRLGEEHPIILFLRHLMEES